MANRGQLWKFNKTLQKIVEVGSAEDIEDRVGRGRLYIQGDEIPPTMSHATSEGLMFTSKSALRRHYREHGFEDTGGSHLQGKDIASFRYKPNREEILHDVRESLRQLQWGEVPFTEREREVCRQEEREYQQYRKRQA